VCCAIDHTFYSGTLEAQVDIAASLEEYISYDYIGSEESKCQIGFNSYYQNSVVSKSFEVFVSGITNPTLPSSDNAIDYGFQTFSPTSLDAPEIISFATIGYENTSIGNNFQPIADNRNYFIGIDNNLGLAGQLTLLNNLQSQANLITSCYNFYFPTFVATDTTLSKFQGELTNDINAITSQMTAYCTAPTVNYLEPVLKSLTYGSPQLAYNTGYETHGGTGGTPFDDFSDNNNTTIDAFIRNLGCIEAIQLSTSTGNSGVSWITTSYTYAAPDSAKNWSCTHGKNQGTLTPVLTLGAESHIWNISGRTGSRVDWLQFNSSNTGLIEEGDKGGDKFEANFLGSDVPLGFVLGFGGRSSKLIDQFGFHYANFEAATWGPLPV
jgi:hypothetical protein